TPQYLAPEVLAPNSVCSSDGSYDERFVCTELRADVWSLGVILFVMLTGHYPFRSSEVLDNSRKAPPSPQRPVTKSLQELRIRLPQAPKNVSKFKTELDSFSLKHGTQQ
ncbi:CIPK15, partial [Symbiodinium microadriaticum]